MSLRGSDGMTWAADEWDIFECLLAIRKQVEPLGVLVCCNGSRRDAWASGMARDMGGGRTVYLLSGVRAGERPPMVETLAPASPEDVVIVAEQLAWFASHSGFETQE